MKYVFQFIRIFIVIFCFIADVKVKADIVIESISGQVELETNHDLVSPALLKKLPTKITESKSFDVLTSDNGSTRFSIEDQHTGVGYGSVYSLGKDGVALFTKGKIFFSIHPKNIFKIKTPQGEIESTGGEFLVQVSGGKTNLDVISGSATLIDRAAGKHYDLEAGYTSWLGGLKAEGYRAHPVRAEAFDLDRVFGQIRVLMGWSDKEFQSRLEGARAPWKKAVFKVAEEAQAAIDSDIKTLNQILLHERQFEARKNREHALLKKLFREKTIGVPYENTELPSESDRDPASQTE